MPANDCSEDPFSKIDLDTQDPSKLTEDRRGWKTWTSQRAAFVIRNWLFYILNKLHRPSGY